jgi:hypothetical protein
MVWPIHKYLQILYQVLAKTPTPQPSLHHSHLALYLQPPQISLLRPPNSDGELKE